jgi:hypothetical protein
MNEKETLLNRNDNNSNDEELSNVAMNVEVIDDEKARLG